MMENKTKLKIIALEKWFKVHVGELPVCVEEVLLLSGEEKKKLERLIQLKSQLHVASLNVYLN